MNRLRWAQRRRAAERFDQACRDVNPYLGVAAIGLAVLVVLTFVIKEISIDLRDASALRHAVETTAEAAVSANTTAY